MHENFKNCILCLHNHIDVLACTLCRYGWCVHGMSRLVNVLCISRNGKECAHCMYVVIHLYKDYCTSYVYSHTIRTYIHTEHTHTHIYIHTVHTHSTNTSTYTQYTHVHIHTAHSYLCTYTQYIHTVHTRLHTNSTHTLPYLQSCTSGSCYRYLLTQVSEWSEGVEVSSVQSNYIRCIGNRIGNGNSPS